MRGINDHRLQRFRLWQDRLSDPLLTALTILLAATMFLIAPLHAAGVIQSQRVGFAAMLLLLGGVLLVSKSLLAIGALSVGYLLAGASVYLRLHRESVVDVYLDAAAFLIMGCALIWLISHAVFAPGRVTYHRIVGAVLLYLVIALVFVALFLLVGLLVPKAFSGIAIEDSPALISNMIYFSLVTLTSTGYGDILPVYPVARSLCNLEMIVGQLYPATLLARLVTLEITSRAG